MSELIGVFADVFINNPLTISLTILGVICIVLAIIGQIPPMDIKGARAITLGGFGFLLIFVALILSWLIATESSSRGSEVNSLPTTQAPIEQDRPSATNNAPIGASTPTIVEDQSSIPSCDQNPIVAENAVEGTEKTYVRCPVGEVEYVIQPDDILVSIVLDCPGVQPVTIPFTKNDALSEGQLLPIYNSGRFTSAQGCKVLITIVNTVADQMGYRLRQELR